jgi:hypothetical protein
VNAHRGRTPPEFSLKRFIKPGDRAAHPCEYQKDDTHKRHAFGSKDLPHTRIGLTQGGRTREETLPSRGIRESHPSTSILASCGRSSLQSTASSLQLLRRRAREGSTWRKTTLFRCFHRFQKQRRRKVAEEHRWIIRGAGIDSD